MTTETTASRPPTSVARGSIVHRAALDDVAVYRLYDAAGSLLYIGASKDPVHRWSDEHRHAPWWSEVAAYEWTRHPSRAEARSVEQEALRAKPGKYNVHGTARHGENQRRQRAAERESSASDTTARASAERQE